MQGEAKSTLSNLLKDESWNVIDASGSLDEVHEACRAVADRAVGEAKGGAPIRQLWDLAPLPSSE